MDARASLDVFIATDLVALLLINLAVSFPVKISFTICSGWVLLLLLQCAGAFAQVTGRSAGQSLQAAPQEAPQKTLANFVDQAEKAGLTMRNVFGGEKSKKYIIETTGTGV